MTGAPAKAVTEITAFEPVADIQEITIRVERWAGPEATDVIWNR